MKPKLKLGFADTHDHIAKFFYSILSERYNVEVSEKDFDFLIFGDENFGTTNKKYSKDDCIKIFYTGENRRPENYDCHYAISFDHNFEPWHYRLPLFVVYMWALNYIHNLPYEYDYIFNPEIKEKTGFASFVVGNPNCKERNDFFDKLNAIKQVDSPGKVRNNMDIKLEGEQAKIDFLSSRKFNIAFEPSSYPGYVTEKILHAFYAGTIPIYWGNPFIGIDFNRNSFINVHDFKSQDHAIDYVMRVDSDDELYNAIVRQPKFMYNIPPTYIFANNFLNWFDAVVYKKIGARKDEDLYIHV